MKDYDKFYKSEEPELLAIKGGELRLYREGKRLAVSRPSWEDENGAHMGKTVTVNLAANAGNTELIDLLGNVIEMLKC